MSVLTEIVSIDGRLAGSKGASAAASISGCPIAASAWPADTFTGGGDNESPVGSVLRWISPQRFNRAQRETKFSGTVTRCSPVLFHGRQASVPQAGVGA